MVTLACVVAMVTSIAGNQSGGGPATPGPYDVIKKLVM